MTVSTLTDIVTYTGNSAATQFAVPFKVLDVAHLSVKRLVAATGAIDYTYAGTEFSYSGVGTPAGTLTLNGTALSSTYKLQIRRIVPYTQDLDLINAGGFYPDTVEKQLDMTVMGLQQVAAEADRALVLPAGETSAVLPAASDRANKYLGFDSLGRATLQPLTVTSAVGQSVTSRTLLAAITTPANGQVAYLAEKPNFGFFEWVAGDQTARIAADPYQSQYVQHATIAATVGCWARLDRDLIGIDLRDFRVKGGTGNDFTGEVANAITQALAENVARLLIPGGVIDVSKLTVASYGHTAAGLRVLELCGVAQPSTLFGTAQIANTLSTSGSILKSAATGNAILRCLDDGAGGQSLYHVVIRDLTLRSYDNPNITAVDMAKAAQFSGYNLSLDTGVYPTVAGSEPVHAGVFGIQMPLNGNGAISRLQNVIAQGYHIGIGVEEHSSFSDVAVYSCSLGLYLNAANHSSRFERIHLANCPYFIYAEPTSPTVIPVDMAQVSFEHYNAAIEGVSWQTTIADVYDPSDRLNGEMRFEAGLGYVAGVEDPIVKTGGRNFSCLRIGKQYPLVSLGLLAANQAIATGVGGGAISFTDSKTEAGAAVKPSDHTYYTITDTGAFSIDFRGAFAGSAAGTYRRAELYYGGVLVDQAIAAPIGTNQIALRLRCPIVNNTAATDVRVLVYHDVGANLNFIGDGNSSGVLTVTKLKTQQAT